MSNVFKMNIDLQEYRENFRIIMRFTLILLFFFISCQDEIQSDSIQNIYNNVSPENYLTGNYIPEKVLVPFINPREKTSVFLRKEAADAFAKMISDFENEKNIPVRQHIFITSGFRSFNSQKSIWEGKHSGARKMRTPVAGKSPREINSLILEYSSAPGTSRHHWGTDFDINVLTNDYYKKGGRGEFIYKWLQQNGRKYGFCQPYNEATLRSNKGYFEERWHWSYFPLSARFTREWITLYKQGKISFRGKFAGSDYLEQLPLTYVEAINQECMK